MIKTEHEHLAFNDFKNAVSKKEFESVLSVVRDEYNKLKSIKEKELEFVKNSENTTRQMIKDNEGMPIEFANKLIEGLKRKASKKVNKLLKKEISRHRDCTDFLNRFQDSNEILPYINFE